MKRFIAAISLAILAGSASAAGDPGEFERSPLDRPPSGIRDPLEVRNPLVRPPSRNARLPELPGSGMSNPSGDMHARPLPGQRAPLVGEPLPVTPPR
jgi:hypothetical protein